MSRLVEELKQEHKAIVHNLNQIKALGVTSEEGQKKLALAKAGLLAHLRKEDEKLYPKMKIEAAANPELKRTLDLFGKDMDKVSSAALAFFDKYAGGGSGLEFAKDFGLLIATLTQRIHKEENVLYEKYNQIDNKSNA
ncbi:hemerythrin domain-containing protein [Aliikangiella sp. IMCC44653]